MKKKIQKTVRNLTDTHKLQVQQIIMSLRN